MEWRVTTGPRAGWQRDGGRARLADATDDDGATPRELAGAPRAREALLRRPTSAGGGSAVFGKVVRSDEAH